MAQNKHKQLTTKQMISTLTSLGGYMIICVLVGMYLDNKFFNNGISVIISALVGIFLVAIGIVRLVKYSNDS